MFLILVYEQCIMDLLLNSWPDNLTNFFFFFFLTFYQNESLGLWSLFSVKGAGEIRDSQVLYVQLCCNCWCSSSFTLYAYLIAGIFCLSVTQADKNTILYHSFSFWYMKAWLLICFWESTPRSFRLDKLLLHKSLCYSVHVHFLVLGPQLVVVVKFIGYPGVKAQIFLKAFSDETS